MHFVLAARVLKLGKFWSTVMVTMGNRYPFCSFFFSASTLTGLQGWWVNCIWAAYIWKTSKRHIGEACPSSGSGTCYRYCILEPKTSSLWNFPYNNNIIWETKSPIARVVFSCRWSQSFISGVSFGTWKSFFTCFCILWKDKLRGNKDVNYVEDQDSGGLV